VVGLFETADPEVGRGGETLAVEDFLAAGEARVAALHPQPALQARMEHVLGRIRLARGDYRQARALFERAGGRRRAAAEPDEAFAVDLGLDLARALETTSDLEGSERMLDELLPRLRRVRGDDHPLVSRTLVRLGRLRGGPQGAALAERALAIERRRRPPNRTELGRALAGVAEHRSLAGDRAAAEALFGEAAEIFAREHGDEHPYTQTTLTNLAGVLDDFDRQEALYRRLIAIGRQVFGADSAPVANRLHRLGVLLGRHGRRAEAEAALSEAERIWTEVGGPEHWRTVRARESLAELHESSGSDRGDRSRGSRPR
jgi:tetratricopeptide (TPR) repeat protein